MGDSDVNRRGVKEWLTRSVQSFLRSPKWRIIWEWVQRLLSSLFHPTVPKFLAYGIILAAIVWIFWIWLCEPPIRFYCAAGVNSAPLGTIYSTLIVVLATVSALVLSLMFITVQLSSNMYTPRVMKIHFQSWHFFGFSFILLGTIIYLSLRLGQAQNWGLPRCNWAETGFILFLACLLLFIPYIWISVRLLQPKHLFERLMWSITRNDFRKASGGARKASEKLEEKLQPVIDIIRRAARDGQLRSVEEAFEAMLKRFGKMIRRSKEEPLSNQIAASLSEGLFEIGRFANTQECFEVSMRVLTLLKIFIERYVEGATKRTSATVLFGTFKKLRDDFVLRYDKKKWPVEHDAVTILFAECQALIADILSK
ncbi:MAG: DUF2254 domain-containing protein [Candidatus Stahlbacteria bacterium]|nr:MAG: DUF2254 domain-containing protein [Candidatus Stahlbacteria bacterium]